MVEIGLFLCAMVWFALGGWAYGKLPGEPSVPGFFVCIVPGPAMFGYVIASREESP